MNASQWRGRYESALMNTFATPQRVLTRGEGCWVWDADGKRYLDLLAGIAVNALGHCHPRLVSAIAAQAGELMHVSNLFASAPQIELAERLNVIAGAGLPARTFLANSGSEANEAALKVTRLTGRTKIVAMAGSFHGRTLGALSLTAAKQYREPFEPLAGPVVWVPYGDADALAAAVDDQTAAVVLEPLQGESGVVEPPSGYLALARQLCDDHGALLWFDEVQTGIGRTGDWLASLAQGVRGDLITLAKGLGGGFPIGACVAVGPAAELMRPGQHGTTFGGNPLAARAALTVLDVIEADGLLGQATRTGAWLAEAIEGLGLPQVSQVRGRGLLRGVVLAAPSASQVAARALAAGFIVNAPRPDVLRLAPPLIVTKDELQTFVTRLPELVS